MAASRRRPASLDGEDTGGWTAPAAPLRSAATAEDPQDIDVARSSPLSPNGAHSPLSTTGSATQRVRLGVRELPRASPSGGGGALTWVVVDALPEVEGDDLPLESRLRNDFTLADMKRWCESNAHCVGFAYWADGRNPFHRDGWFYPKERGTGFDEGCSAWVDGKYSKEVWQWYYIKERAKPSQAFDTAVPSTSLVNHDSTFTPLMPERVPSFLEARGFSVIDCLMWRLVEPLDWCSWMPTLHCNVKNHEEAGAHTWYSVHSALLMPGSERRLDWKAPRRLVHLQELHNHLKATLGSEGYNEMFLDPTGQRVHFAHRGGMYGTTARLDAWFSALALSINNGRTTPAVVALVLHFLRAPAAEDPRPEEEGGEEEVSPPPWVTELRPELHPESPHPHQTGRVL